MKNINSLKPFPKFCHSIGYIPTSYKISMTYEEQLWWFCDFLENKVIPTVNQNGEAVEELQNLYIQLKDYVDNYFEDLDIQQEINNKLDEMAESGELTEIIAQYLQLAGVLAYDTVADMKVATNLIDGSICKTLGYRTIGDNGSGLYKIRTVTTEDVIDEGTIIALTSDNTLIAELIVVNDTVTPEQFGAYGDGTHDDTSFIEEAIKYTTNPHKVQFSSKTYAIQNIQIDYEYGNVILQGVNSHYRHYDFEYATKIIPYSGMTGVMFTVGETGVATDYMVFGFTVKNICFTGNDINGYNYNVFDFGRSSNVYFQNVIFRRVNGYCLNLQGVYDSLFDNVEFMDNGNDENNIGDYTTIITQSTTANGITASNALRFINCRWEGNNKDIHCLDNYFQLMFTNCKIEHSNITRTKILLENYSQINFTGCIFTTSGNAFLMTFGNTRDRCLCSINNCTFTAPSSGNNGGKWIDNTATGYNNWGLNISDSTFNMPSFTTAIKLGKYSNFTNNTFYSYSGDAMTNIIEANTNCMINNIIITFVNNTTSTNGVFFNLTSSNNIIKNIKSSTAVIDVTNLVNNTVNNILEPLSQDLQNATTNTINALKGSFFNIASSTTLEYINNSWLGCEISFYANGSNVVVDFTHIPLVWNYVSSVTIPAGRVLTLRKVTNERWILKSLTS